MARHAEFPCDSPRRRELWGASADEATDELPELGDVLEDAGCTEDEILDPLRGPVPHVLGCRVLDLILAKR